MHQTRRTLFATITLAAAALCAGAAFAQTPAGKPRVDSAWARPTVAGQTAGGGFITITGGSATDRLVSASSDAAQAVELHTMSMDGGVMRMRRVDGIDVAAGQKVELKPGGMHLMFMGLKAPLQAGRKVPVVLKFKEAGDVRAEMTVSATAPGGMASMPEGMHGHKH